MCFAFLSLFPFIQNGFGKKLCWTMTTLQNTATTKKNHVKRFSNFSDGSNVAFVGPPPFLAQIADNNWTHRWLQVFTKKWCSLSQQLQTMIILIGRNWKLFKFSLKGVLRQNHCSKPHILGRNGSKWPILHPISTQIMRFEAKYFFWRWIPLDVNSFCKGNQVRSSNWNGSRFLNRKLLVLELF